MVTVKGTRTFGGVTTRSGWVELGERGDRMGWGFVVGLWGQSLGGCGWRGSEVGAQDRTLPVPLLWVPKHSLSQGLKQQPGGRALTGRAIDATVQLKILPCPPQHGSKSWLVAKSAC